MNNIRLVKSKSKPNEEGHYFWNYYIVFDNGRPIQIKLAFPKKSLSTLLWAIAEEVTIQNTAVVSPAKGDK